MQTRENRTKYLPQTQSLAGVIRVYFSIRQGKTLSKVGADLDAPTPVAPAFKDQVWGLLDRDQSGTVGQDEFSERYL